MLHLKEELEKRGLLYQHSHEELFDLYNNWWQSLYFGVDPTADSLHLGNYVVFMQAVNYMKRWNKLFLIVWGATGMIWDPGGKDSERTFLSEDTLEHNVQAIINQVQWILEHLTALTWEKFEFQVINNMVFYEWMWYIDFLRKVGKYITVNSMIKKETVRKRIEEADKSISYTEFSYMLIQWNDYVRLYEDYGVRLQICGSDQRWNSVTGMELIRKIHHDADDVFVASGPLLLDAHGKKFGKSEGNAIWLDRKKNSPYYVYQYFMNTNDEDVERYLKVLTLLPFDRIENIVKEHNMDTSKRYGQQQLSSYVVTTVFGAKAAEEAEKVSKILFSHKDERINLIKDLKENEIDALSEECGGFVNIEKNTNIMELAVKSGLAESNGEVKKMIQQWALFVNEEQIVDIASAVSESQYVNGILLMRKGKKTFKVVRGS